ncbi:hypothetical protein HanPSC8_Chr09g0376191 [Helianthus annuus]|nr:hypothetical protein HanPSC8_Chr09g0376191 [Helianthus annuus]
MWPSNSVGANWPIHMRPTKNNYYIYQKTSGVCARDFLGFSDRPPRFSTFPFTTPVQPSRIFPSI